MCKSRIKVSAETKGLVVVCDPIPLCLANSTSYTVANDRKFYTPCTVRPHSRARLPPRLIVAPVVEAISGAKKGGFPTSKKGGSSSYCSNAY